jgi:asparagine synthase (glutamine-hydrolysing)
MCGIAGIISITGVNRERLKKMTDAQAHRGPDGEGFWTNDDTTTALGHRRLAIIDTSHAAAQPMHFASRYTIVHNGEIYNYIELREQLQKKGYVFVSQSDTEVILAAYDCWQQDCLPHFDGMFAFAIWDEQDKQLFAARDRLGEKPFHYFFDEGKKEFAFASEIKGLWAAGVPKNIDSTMLLNYIVPGYVQNPADKTQTFFQGIYSLPPASYLTLSLEALVPVIKKYWQPGKTVQQNITADAAIEKFGQLLQTSVSRRLRSDVPLGTSLSGGIDSGAIAAILSRQGHTSYKTFSAVFPGFEKDESAKIKTVTDVLKLSNYQTKPDAAGLIQDFEKLCYHQEQPFGSASIYAQYKVFELAAQQGVTVLLDGQGADEILSGYSKYIHWYLQELWLGSKKDFTNAKQALIKNGVAASWGTTNRLAAYFPAMAAKQLTERAVKAQQQQPDINKDFLMQYQDKSTLQKPVIKNLNDALYADTVQMGLEELLRYADRNSMAHGREARLPFLNHELVEFMFSLPAQFKINEGYSKWILRKSIAALLPAEIVWQTKKTGFEPPQQQWMQTTTLQDYLQEAKRSLVKQGVLNPQVLQKKVQPKAAHDIDNFDWRYLTAASTLL